MPIKPYYQDNHNTIHCLDFRKNELPDECVQAVCTSPPYFGLRKYAGEQELIWGGDDCQHEWGEYIQPAAEGTRTLEGNSALRAGHQGTVSATMRPKVSAFCSLCSAWRGQLGLEPTMELYIQHLIEIMREIKRVLRKDGVFYLNIGDSYAGSGSPGGDFRNGKGGDEYLRPYNRKGGVLKPKDMCLIPFRIAIAAQEDGWWVRSVIIWEKKNPMPESCTDRPTESHEYILMLTKSGTAQYWTHRDGGGTRQRPKADYRWVKRNNIRGLKTKGLQELNGEEQHHGLGIDPNRPTIIEEVAIEPPDWKVKIKCPDCEATGKVNIYLGLDVWQERKCPTCDGRKETQLWKRINLWRGHDYYWDADAVRETGQDWGTRDRTKFRGGTEDPLLKHRGLDNANSTSSGRNIRSVWTFPTTPFPGFKIDGKEIDHFAVFAEKLPERCIKAATPEVGCCSKCGAPWERVVKKETHFEGGSGKAGRSSEDINATGKWAGQQYGENIKLGPVVDVRTLGWQPTCTCNADKVPSLVLDPMMGAGTTLLVAKKLNRRCGGYELSQEYCQLAVERCRQQVLM